MSELRIRTLSPGEPANWPESLTQLATFTALDAWTNISRRIYNSPVHRFEAENEDGVHGLLSLVQVSHPVFGKYMATAPFGSYGGFAAGSPDAHLRLLEQAQTLVVETGISYVNIRFDRPDLPLPDGWVNQPLYCTYLVTLSEDPENLLPAYSSDHRNHIRKSLKKGHTLHFGHLDLLEDAYLGLARSMHELGSPYHSKAYLRFMAESLQSNLEFAVQYDAKGKIAGAGVFIKHGDVVTNLHANILRHARGGYAGEFLYWGAIERYGRMGLKIFDLGRSLIGSGNEVFKMKWTPERKPLAYWYWLAPGAKLPALNQKNPKFSAAIAIWKRLPGFVVRLLGPHLIRGLA